MQLEPCAELPNQKFSMPKVHGSDDLLYIKPDESNGTHCLRLDYLHIEADVPVHKYWCEEKTPWQVCIRGRQSRHSMSHFECGFEDIYKWCDCVYLKILNALFSTRSDEMLPSHLTRTASFFRTTRFYHVTSSFSTTCCEDNCTITNTHQRCIVQSIGPDT